MTLSGELLSKIEDPSVQELIRPNIGTIWLGPDKHCVLYPMRNRTEWNLVLMWVPPTISKLLQTVDSH